MLRHREARGRQLARVLRGAWRARPDADAFAGADLLEVAPLLLRSGSAALAWWRARSSAADPAVVAPLHDALAIHTLTAAIRGPQVAAAFARLRDHGVEALLGKGWAVARLYPHPGLRPYGDIDLYVRRPDAAAARTALDASNPALPVDLHVGFAELDDRAGAELFARAVAVRMGDADVRVFGPEDHLRLLALHMLRHGAWRPVWLCDLALLIETRASDFDWAYFTSGDACRTDAAVCALHLAEELVGARLEGVPAALRERSLPRWLVPAVLRQWGEAGFEPHGTRTPMAVELRRPRGLPRALRLRWPNPVEATIGRRAPFNDLPRLPFQLGECLSRTVSYAYAAAVGRALER